MEDSKSLANSIEVYKTQLSQINETLKVTPPGVDKDNLISLKNDVEELLKLTQDSIDSLQSPQIDNECKDLPEDDPFSKEYALFKAELESLDNVTNIESQTDEQPANIEDDEEDDISLQNELQDLLGTKCRAPYANKSGSTTYYNALISGVEMEERLSDIDHIKVRVLFINPTEKKMTPCPYFLDDKCKFNEEGCNFSHGNIVLFDQLKEYIEPNFSLLKRGCRVLAKIPNMSTWISTVVEDLGKKDTCIVKYQRAFVELPLHDVLPPLDDTNSSDSLADNEDEENMDDDLEVDNKRVELLLAQNQHHEAMIDLSLTRTQPTNKLGQWEEYTKGIGSKLMAKMGYIVGTGLGKSGDGILQPVEPVVLPAGKSLDHCMNLKEAAGGSNNLLTVEKMQKKLAAKVLARSKREYIKRKKQEKDVFYVINTTVGTAPSTSSKNITRNIVKNLGTISDRQLNVERFKVSEDIKQSENSIKVLKRSLEHHKASSNKFISAKLDSKQRELIALKNAENKLEREQIRRSTKKKMTIF